MKLFIAPIIISLIALIGVFIWGGPGALMLALLLSVLEITLSFDNAVVNAKVLNQMSEKWQKRFLTWGILLAVFGTRLVLPVLIVALAAAVSPIKAILLAFENPEEYGRLLEHASPAILAFGGAFLLMVSLKYFFDVGKSVHWISLIEKHLVKWGRIEAIEIGIALTALLSLSYLGARFGHGEQGVILAAGVIGIILFVVIQGIASTLHMGGESVARTGATLFVYLNVLDAAFSLDGVVGAFALTSQVLVIFVGLGIGAYFVRSITVYLVRKKTLDSLRYLEHGAHWAILGLALSMLVGLVVHVPEWVTGCIGLLFVSLAYVSSLKALKKTV